MAIQVECRSSNNVNRAFTSCPEPAINLGGEVYCKEKKVAMRMEVNVLNMEVDALNLYFTNYTLS